jgi:hypothetical protein
MLMNVGVLVLNIAVNFYPSPLKAADNASMAFLFVAGIACE